MHTTRSTWFDWHPLQRFALALGISALAYFAQQLAWAIRLSLSSGSWFWPRTYETWPLELASYASTVTWTALPLLLAGLFRPRKARGWVACALGGALLAFALGQAWIVQLGLWRSGAPAMDYTKALADLQRFHGALYKHYGWAYAPAQLLSFVPLWTGLWVGWLAQRERWLRWSWVLAALPLAAHVAGTAITFGVIGRDFGHQNLLVIPNLVYGLALVGSLGWLQSRREQSFVFDSPETPRAGPTEEVEPAPAAGGWRRPSLIGDRE